MFPEEKLSVIRDYLELEFPNYDLDEQYDFDRMAQTFRLSTPEEICLVTVSREFFDDHNPSEINNKIKGYSLNQLFKNRDITRAIITTYGIETEPLNILKKISSIIKKRLVETPSEVKLKFPTILQEDWFSWKIFPELKYILVVFCTKEDEERINNCISKRINPFFGLITSEEQKAAFRVGKTGNVRLKNNIVSGSFSFSLGPDTTILLENHHQSIQATDLNEISYTIPLAYIISYGSEINYTTICEYFEGIVAYSTELWRGDND